MSPAVEQLSRVRRYLTRMERMGASDCDVDDLYSFFLNAWHLIDWASNHPAIRLTYEQLKAEVEANFSRSIWLCNDIAQGSKHFKLTKPARTAPAIAHTNTRITPGANQPPETLFTFSFPDGSTRDALALAREVVADWERILSRHGLP